MIEKKKIFTTIVIFLVLFLTPLLKVEATWTYIGIKIDSAKKTDGTVFCLKPDTKMYICNVSDPSCTSPLDTIATTTEKCAEDNTGPATDHQIWSNLVDLTNSTQYNIKLTVPLCFGYWHKDTGINTPYKCWYRGTQNDGYGRGETCIQVCADNNTTVSGSCGNFVQICSPPSNAYCNDWDENCGAGKALLPQHSSDSCNQAYHAWTGYHNTSTYYASNTHPGSMYGCGWSDGNVTQICVCAYNTGNYTFPFTFSTGS